MVIQMKQVKVSVPDYVYAFYAKVGRSVGRPVAEVMSEALFYKAGELAQEVLGVQEDDGQEQQNPIS